MTIAKHPIQVYLDDRQKQALRRLAEQENTTLSELIRRGVDLLLTRLPAGKDPAYRLIGLGGSGESDMAENHDEYIVQEIEKEWER